MSRIATDQWARVLSLAISTLFCATLIHAQRAQEQGHSIGSVSVNGNLITMELNEDVLGRENMFDLAHRTLRFTPGKTGYRVENIGLQWDPEFGAEQREAQVTLHQFAFPFSGKAWNSLFVNTTGTITFGSPQSGPAARAGGFGLARFDQLGDGAATLINTAPAISAFLKPRMSGIRYVKELADRLVVTWSLSEPVGGIQDFTWTPTTNRFQTVLRENGTITLSYEDVAACDAIVGLYPLAKAGVGQTLGTIPSEENAAIPANVDLKNVKVSAVDKLFLNISFETRGPILPEGDPRLAGITYRVYLDGEDQTTAKGSSNATVVWSVRGFGSQGRGSRGGFPSRYVPSGPGVSRNALKVSGNSISIQGILPPALKNARQISLRAEVATSGGTGSRTPAIVDQIPAHVVKLAGIRSPEVDFSSLSPKDGPFDVVYESFHYVALPNPRDLTCTVIRALGDKYDFLAYYSDFRVDNQEAGTPSTGPLGGNVTGIGAPMGRPDTYCSEGRFQWQFVQPIYIGSNQGQEKSSDGKMTNYDLAMSQIGHEMGHRWSAFVSAKIGDDTIPLGPTHWAKGLHAPVAFPYKRPTEASAMGGGVWQDNYDGTFTQLDDDYYVPPTGWSYLDLYLMGMITAAEVPDFFILKSLTPAGKDANGHPVYKGDRTKVTISDVIAAEGTRSPASGQAQKAFNTGIVAVVMHGATPSKELLERANAIRERWMDYWSITTGRRSTMTTNPR